MTRAVYLAVALLVGSCVQGPGQAPAEPAPEAPRPSSQAEQGPELYNAEWRLLKMALAHGVMVIEVEVADPTRALEVARGLREPLGEEYDEVLVYIQRMGGATEAPVRRVRWTKRDGYEELVY